MCLRVLDKMNTKIKKTIPIVNYDKYLHGTSSLYWVYDQETTNPYHSGYIGMTELDPKNRINGHVKALRPLINGKTKHPKVFLLRMLNDFDSLSAKLLATGLDSDQAKYLEFLFRPNYSIGWNMSIGGGSRSNNELFKTKFINEFNSIMESSNTIHNCNVSELLDLVRRQSKIDKKLISKELLIYLSVYENDT